MRTRLAPRDREAYEMRRAGAFLSTIRVALGFERTGDVVEAIDRVVRSMVEERAP